MSDSVRIICGDIALIALTVTFCLALAVVVALGIMCVVKWLSWRF